MRTHLPKRLMNIFVCAILMLTAFTTTAQVAPTSNVIYVKTGASGNGSSWSNPADLATALQWAQANKDNNLWDGTDPLKIYVAKGIYKPAIDPSTNAVPVTGQERNATFLMVNNVQLYGGFPDSGTPGINDRDWNANPTVLSGDISAVDDNTDNAYHVVISAGDVATAELNGFTVKDGNADVSGTITVNGKLISKNNGGGMFNRSSSPTLVNLSISGNTATYGGGMYNISSSLTLANVSISGNTANNSGGGIFNISSSSSTLTNVSISGNTATINGGGIDNSFSSLNIYNTILVGNNSGIYEGNGSALVIKYSLIQGLNSTTDGNISAAGITALDIFVDPQSPGLSTAGDYSLKTGSIAVDAGNNSLYIGLDASTVDLAGKPRVFKFTSGGVIDLGAYELQIIKPDANGIVYVSATGKGDESGDSWTNASGDLQRAINTNGVQQVWVSAGTYKPRYRSDNMSGASANDRDNAFVLKKDVKIYGGFAGTESLLNQRDFTRQSNNTILSGDLGTVNDISDNAYHVVISGGDVGTAELNGFTITGGNANGGATPVGGGIFNSSSSPILANLTINSNTANYGGGMFISSLSSSPIITNVIISGNTASSGGGIFNSGNCSPIITNVTISGNTANYGGGIYNSISSLSIYNTILIGNNSGIYEGSNITTIKHSLIQDLNSTTDGNISAAGITALDIFLDPQSPGLSTAGDYSLKTGSIAVNAGDNSLYIGLDASTVDLAGKPRVVKYNSGGVIDLGAYELQVIKPDANGIVYVSTTGRGDQSGDSWTNASGDLQKAINASDVQQVWVSAGTYKPQYRADNMSGADANDRDNAFVLKKDVKIYGGFAGTESLLTQRDSTRQTNNTVLSGDLGTVNDIADNAYHVVISAGDAGSAELNGFTITGGNADGSGYITVNGQIVYQLYGGGTVNYSSSPVFANLNISGNAANKYGGGMFINSSSPTLTNISISGNTSNNYGGAIFNRYSSPKLANVSISGNTAPDGGAMYNISSSPNLANVSISGNTATNGGAMYNTSSSPTLLNSIIWGNNSGIYEENGSISVIKYSLIQGLTNTDNGNIADTDPQFVSTTDFRLQAGSPAIDKGDPNTNTTSYNIQVGATDLAGAIRIQNGRIDMGAYERITTLPVALVSYIVKVENNAVQLQWQTASEQNNKGFVLYRSGDDEVFTKIGFINGKDNSSAPDSYYFYDKQPLSGNNYYRLVQVDNNGKETDLGLRTATFNFQPSTFNLYPNPTADIVTATFPAGHYHSLEITDLNGRVLQHIALKASESQKELNLGSYPSGTYLIIFKGKGHTDVLKAIRK